MIDITKLIENVTKMRFNITESEKEKPSCCLPNMYLYAPATEINKLQIKTIQYPFRMSILLY